MDFPSSNLRRYFVYSTYTIYTMYMLFVSTYMEYVFTSKKNTHNNLFLYKIR